MDQTINPVFDIIPADDAVRQNTFVSEMIYSPNSRGVLLTVVGSVNNPAGNFDLHFVLPDMLTGKLATGKGQTLALNTDDLHAIVVYPFGNDGPDYIATTIPCYWRVAVVPPVADTDWIVTIGAQLLI